MSFLLHSIFRFVSPVISFVNEITDYLLNVVTFLLTRLCGVELSLYEIKNKTLHDGIPDNLLTLDEARDLDTLLNVAKMEYEKELFARQEVFKRLFILVPLTFIAFLTALFFHHEAIYPLAASLYLSWVSFNLYYISIPTIFQEDVTLSGDDLRKSGINTYMECSYDLEGVNLYLEDIYMATRGWLFFAFVLTLTKLFI
jgi:hypothetical protein